MQVWVFRSVSVHLNIVWSRTNAVHEWSRKPANTHDGNNEMRANVQRENESSKRKWPEKHKIGLITIYL